MRVYIESVKDGTAISLNSFISEEDAHDQGAQLIGEFELEGDDAIVIEAMASAMHGVGEELQAFAQKIFDLGVQYGRRSVRS